MPFAYPLFGTLHLLTSAFLFQIVGSSLESLQMKDFLFVERRSHSSLELVKEFFNRTLLPPCDLTANACDFNCCNDKDCGEEHIEQFDCLGEADSFTVDPIFADPFHCHSNVSSDSSSVDPVFCYELENSPFLGVYFLEEKVLKRKALEPSLANIVASKYFNNGKPPSKHKHDLYIYGVPVEQLDDGSPINLPSTIIGNGYCSQNQPIRFLIDTTSVCLSHINVELCENSPKFDLETYFRKDEFGELFLQEIRSGNDSFPSDAIVKVLCGPEIFRIDGFQVVNDIYTECEDLTKVNVAKYDTFEKKCTNVVTKVEYRFIWRENFLALVNVTVILSDVPLETRESIIPSKKDAFSNVAQTFIVGFHKNEFTTSKSIHRGSYVLNDNIVLYTM